MAKRPLLTDDIVEKARRDRWRLEEKLQREMQENKELAEKYDRLEAKNSKKSIYKSRRIENEKTKTRGRHLLRYLFILWIILILMIAWIIFSPWS